MWTHLAFYNFVQEPMETKIIKKEEKQVKVLVRPTPDHLKKGWKVFAELIKMLKPTECIFIGVAAANSFNKEMASIWNMTLAPNQKPYKCRRSKMKVDNVFVRRFLVKIDDHISCPCIAIKHTSRCFSWETWYQFLWDNKKEMMQYLQTI